MNAETQPFPSRGLVSTLLGDFALVNRYSRRGSSEEWMAVLPDETEVVLADRGGAPCAVGLKRAIAIIQSRSYLMPRARQLIEPIFRGDGEWRLVTIDFGAEASRYRCEFLMCFAFVQKNGQLTAESPYLEVGFELPERQSEDPVFRLTIKAVEGIPIATK